MQTKRVIRKSGLLTPLILLTVSGALTSTMASAEEGFFADANLFKNVYIDNLVDGDVQVAGNHHAGLHLTSKSRTRSAQYVSQHAGKSGSDSGIHLSWQMSW